MTTAWHRVEPNGRDEDLEEGLANRVADPLWMLARQWQLGEFRGEDAASPIHARVTVETSPITSFRNRAAPDAPSEPWPHGRLLEPRVEAERVTDGPAAIALAADAGLRFLRALDGAGLAAIRTGVDWRREFGFAPVADDPLLPVRARERLALLASRAVDGRRLARATDATLMALVAAVDASAWTDVAPVVTRWRTDEAAHFDQPALGGDCWDDERLAYAFSVGVPTAGGEVSLVADRYAGGRLDWYAFRIESALPSPPSPPSPPRTPGSPAAPITFERLPTPVGFRGQPAPRWWECEDRSIYFGDLTAGPADLARLVVAEFAAVFSDDWYVVPIELPTGTLNRVTGLDVLDVFGAVHHIPSTAVADHASHGAGRPWAFFELAGDRSAAEGRTPYLFLPPTLASSLDGEPVEHVTLVRDEAANLGWAIEQTIELPTGTPMRRRQQWRDAADPTDVGPITAPAPAVDDDDTDVPWRYRLQTAVPPWWIPLVPEIVGGGPGVRLRRSRMQSWETLDPGLAGAKGEIIGVARALRVAEEEIPRGGVQITRAWQLARGADGRVHLWMARHKRPGRGDRGSHLRFDTLVR
jgi:hypothetical protein